MKRQNELYQSYATTKIFNNKVSDYLMQSEKWQQMQIINTLSNKLNRQKQNYLIKVKLVFIQMMMIINIFMKICLQHESDASVLQKQFLDFEDSFFNELSNIDASYTKRMGKSYLKEINTDETIKDDINMILGIKPVSVVEPPPSGEQEDKGCNIFYKTLTFLMTV